MTNWTDAQKCAIDARGCNLLVAAAAGSGKTAVLVERIIQMIIRDKVDIDKLLIVTFTHAAAGEMRERISAAIIGELEKESENEQHLRRQLKLLNRASISTIHAFCSEIVRRYFHLINIDPNFRIGDTTETDLMKMEALEELFETEYEKGLPHFLGLVEMFGTSKSDSALQELVINLYEFVQSEPYPEKWLEEHLEEFAVDLNQFETCSWVQALIKQLRIQLSAARDVFMDAIAQINSNEGPESYKGALESDIAIVDELDYALNQGIFIFYKHLYQTKHSRLKPLAKNDDKELADQIKGLREEGKTIIADIKKHGLSESPEEYLENLHELYPYMSYLYQLVISFAEIYKDKKGEKGIVDFNDLEHYALEILADERAAVEYRNRYKYVFVDEYQDSNLVQETILNFIKGDNNLFLVGDVKQSIYRFRLADPSLFMDKYKTYLDADGVIDRRIDLNRNFRSRNEIIQGINYIFENIMSEEFGEINYDEKACLYPGLETPETADPAIELCIVEKESEQLEIEEDRDLEEPGNIELEAQVVADRINKILGQEIYDAKLQSYRNLEYRDIVVLLRTTRNWAGVFQETLNSKGIPVYADVSSGYFEAIEISIFLNLLRLIDNKRQDIPLLSVMRSPIADFTIEELIEIRLESKKANYYEAVEDYIAYKDSLLKEKLSNFINQLDIWKEESRFIPLDELIWKLLIDTGYYYYVGAIPGGIQRQANLRILVDRARQFQQTSIKGIFNFIKFIDKLNSSSGDMGEAKILGENDNVVRIMSIHKSKGLEFPVVITSGMGKQFNMSDTAGKVLFHRDLGIGPRYVNPELRKYSDTLPRMAMKNRIKLENLSEEMRILYVACTRPKNKLVMIGSVNRVHEAAKKWSRTISPFNLSRGRNFLDWVGPVIMRHPDGEKLREAAGKTGDSKNLGTDDSRFKVEIIERDFTVKEEIKRKETEEKFRSILEEFPTEEYCGKDLAASSLITAKLDWEYPFRDAEKIPSKLSVTRILGRKNREIENMGINIPALIKRPRFMEGKKSFTGIEKGTIMHFVMQHLDLSRVGDTTQIKKQVQEMVEKELLGAEETRVVDSEKILRFFSSHLGQRVLKADRIYREVPFNQVRQAGELIDGNQNNNETLLIQGVIDLFFLEGDELILIDYKTDYIQSGSSEKILNRYKPQMEMYKYALEKIQGKRVIESYLYLFDTDEPIQIS